MHRAPDFLCERECQRVALSLAADKRISCACRCTAYSRGHDLAQVQALDAIADGMRRMLQHPQKNYANTNAACAEGENG